MSAHADWMGKLPNRVTDRPLVELFIPGSHNSASFDLDVHEKVAPDVSSSLKNMVCVLQRLFFSNMNVLAPMLKEGMMNWMRHQTVDINEQLEMGIRYFDFKVGKAGEEGKVFVLNGLVCKEVMEYLDPIYRFLVKHSKEIAIVRFSLFFGLTADEIFEFENSLSTKFGSLLLEFEEERKLGEFTLKQLWKDQKQILFLSDNPRFSLKHSTQNVWPKRAIFDVQAADSVTIEDVIGQHLVREREEDRIVIWEACVSLRIQNAIKHPVGNFEKEYGRKATREVAEWLRKEGAVNSSSLNIVAADFIDQEDFCNAVISLNR